jgi:SAM-dependent methyltransferase
MSLLSPFLSERVTFLEVGPGDCAVAFEVAKSVKKVYGIDVSEAITSTSSAPHNFQLILSDGSSIRVPKGSIDVVYSNQLMEHLHPDDAIGQLKNILDALVPGGVYVCVTPNKLNGPHDISSDFDSVATGFHMREYTVGELSALFQKVGFSKIEVCVGGNGKYWRCPTLPAVLCETALQILPSKLRRAIAASWWVRGVIGVRLIGFKSA